MSALCAVPGSAAPATYFTGTDLFRKYGFNYFILHTCDYQWTDLLDAAEWTAAVAAGDVKLSPPGALIINEPTQTNFQIEGCGRETGGEATFTVDFTTYQDGAFAAAVPSSAVYWRDVLDNVAGYQISFLDCNRKHFVSNGWMDEVGAGAPASIAGDSPGFEFSISLLPNWQAGQENLGLWKTQFTIKKTGIMEYYQATAAVVAAMG